MFRKKIIGVRFKKKKDLCMKTDVYSRLSALAMLGSGVGLSVAGFVQPPVGEISDSVLWYVAQALIYAGSVFGVTVYIDRRVREAVQGGSFTGKK